MKKSLSIVLIVTMLLSMILAAIPASAAEAQLPVSSWDEPWNSEDGWTEIDSVATFNEVIYNADPSNKKFYLTTDIDLTKVTRVGKNVTNFTIDGNGHSMTWGKGLLTVFDQIDGLTVHNLILTGTATVDNDNAYAGPFGMWHSKGVHDFRNVVSTMTINYNRTKSDSQMAVAFGRDPANGSVFENVIFEGAMNIAKDAAVFGVGGFVGVTNGATFINCTNRANIVFNGSFHSLSAENVGVAGLVAQVNGSTTFRNCVNEGNIKYTGYYRDGDDAVKGYVAGLAGYCKGAMTFIDCANSGAIISENTEGGKHFGYGGGIFGGVEGGNIPVSLTNCHNYGNIMMLASGPWYFGGIAGIAETNATVALDNCSNNGRLQSYHDGALSGGHKTAQNGMGGILGYAYGDKGSNYHLKMTNVVNNGKMEHHANCKTGSGMWGGMVAQAAAVAKITFENCINNADVVLPAGTKATYGGAGGFIGGARVIGATWAGAAGLDYCYTFKNCLNTGDVFGPNASGFWTATTEIQFVKDNRVTSADRITATFENCVNAGNIKATSNAAGFIANLYSGDGGGFKVKFINCANGGNIEGGKLAGGITATTNGASVVSFDKCVNYGAVNGTLTGAGIAAGAESSVDATNCVNLGNISGGALLPISNSGYGVAEGNVYLGSTVNNDTADGAELVSEPDELIAKANGFKSPYVANLGAIYALIDEYRNMDVNEYVAGGDWDGLEYACREAEALFASSGFDASKLSQAEVNEIYLSIIKPRSTIVKKTDVSALKEALEKAEAKLTDGKVYTDATLKNLNEAIEVAETLIAQGEYANAIEVNEAVEDLEKAVSRLRVKPVAADTTELEATIAEVEAFVEAEYTAESWAVLQEALAAAKEALTADKQVTVNNANIVLLNARDALEKIVTDDPNAGGDSNTPSGNATEAPKATEPAAEEGGCGGLVGGAAVVLTAVIALGAGISFKKKED